ncbi:MAG: rhomboid family intramembrane serine protease [Bacteroidetes bacterium]|nr:rhomboid family intramembrane serine protease [Bacteroidota bacterium]MBS1972788.1 rhomboid family intramembrane serine protease [Bacteroidota bacterium]
MIPPVIKNLVIANVLVFIAQQVFANNPYFDFNNTFALHDVHSVYFRPYQLVTYLFMHGGVDHIFFNMFALWMFGSILENVWGGKRFLIFYMLCGLGSALFHLVVLYNEMAPVMNTLHLLPLDQQQDLLYSPNFRVNEATIGASGAVFGCLAAFGYLFPNSLIYLYFFVPIKAKWFVLAYAAMELFLGVRNSAGDSVAHWAHLGGALVGLILVIYWNKTNKRNFY